MKILLISTTEESKLFMLNSITNSLKNLYPKKILVVDLIFINKNHIEDNILFINKEFNNVFYSSGNDLKSIKNNCYDYLIALENTLWGFYLSYIFNAKTKVCFSRIRGFLFFDKFFLKSKKTKKSWPSMEEIHLMMKDIFPLNKTIKPKFYFDNEQIQKNHQMIYWIFKMNHSTELDQEKFIILDLKHLCYFKKNQINLIGDICNYLIEKFRSKIIFLSNNHKFFKEIKKTIPENNRNNFLLTNQKYIKIISFFPLYIHSILIITNKNKELSFLELIKKPVYLFNIKRLLLNSFLKTLVNSENVFKKIKIQTKGEINYILKNINQKITR